MCLDNNNKSDMVTALVVYKLLNNLFYSYYKITIQFEINTENSSSLINNNTKNRAGQTE